jgi:hypothetical protein
MQSHPEQNANLSAFQDILERGILFSMFVDSPSEVIVFDGATLRIIAANQQAQINNVSLPHLRKSSIADLITGIPSARVARSIHMMRRRASHSTGLQITTQTGPQRLLDIQLLSTLDPKPTVIAFIADITPQLRAPRMRCVHQNGLPPRLRLCQTGLDYTMKMIVW